MVDREPYSASSRRLVRSHPRGAEAYRDAVRMTRNATTAQKHDIADRLATSTIPTLEATTARGASYVRLVLAFIREEIIRDVEF